MIKNSKIVFALFILVTLQTHILHASTGSNLGKRSKYHARVSATVDPNPALAKVYEEYELHESLTHSINPTLPKKKLNLPPVSPECKCLQFRLFRAFRGGLPTHYQQLERAIHNNHKNLDLFTEEKNGTMPLTDSKPSQPKKNKKVLAKNRSLITQLAAAREREATLKHIVEQQQATIKRLKAKAELSLESKIND